VRGPSKQFQQSPANRVRQGDADVVAGHAEEVTSSPPDMSPIFDMFVPGDDRGAERGGDAGVRSS
jgi:hypothetical protein